MLNSFKKKLGAHGEDLVERYLNTQGFSIIAKNFSIRGGEVDIIAKKNDLLVFVEVKTRSNNYFNTSEVITPSKQKKIVLTAKHFISQQKISEMIYRFDVALVDGKTKEISYITNAFTEKNQ
jgi:putative endonuclease